MATYAVLIDGKNTGRRRDTSTGVTAKVIRDAEAKAYTNGDTKRVQLFRLV